ncbi:MAG: DUF6455 family protein [Xanthobacteraceae bacterium]
MRASDHDSGETCLLPRRFVALGLDAAEVARLEPIAFRELQRRCCACEAKGQCAWDLGCADQAQVAWADYCLNTDALRALSEIPWFRPATSQDSRRRV